MRIRLTAGQAGDNPQLLPLLDDYRHASTEYALGSTDFRLLADKAYSHPSTRAALRSKKIKHTIPERQDQIDRRKAKGSAGGRPPAFDAALYGLRNTVERGFHRLKQWRGIATRYDKYALTYLGGVLLACAVIHAQWELRSGRHALAETGERASRARFRPANRRPEFTFGAHRRLFQQGGQALQQPRQRLAGRLADADRRAAGQRRGLGIDFDHGSAARQRGSGKPAAG